MSEEHITYLCFGESIDILPRVYTLRHRISIDMSREGGLDDESVDFFIRGQSSYLGFEFCLGDSVRIPIEPECHTDFACTFFLHADICLRRWIVPDEHDCEHGLLWDFRISDLVPDGFEEGGGDGASVEYHIGRVL